MDLPRGSTLGRPATVRFIALVRRIVKRPPHHVDQWVLSEVKCMAHAGLEWKCLITPGKSGPADGIPRRLSTLAIKRHFDHDADTTGGCPYRVAQCEGRHLLLLSPEQRVPIGQTTPFPDRSEASRT